MHGRGACPTLCTPRCRRLAPPPHPLPTRIACASSRAPPTPCTSPPPHGGCLRGPRRCRHLLLAIACRRAALRPCPAVPGAARQAGAGWALVRARRAGATVAVRASAGGGGCDTRAAAAGGPGPKPPSGAAETVRPHAAVPRQGLGRVRGAEEREGGQVGTRCAERGVCERATPAPRPSCCHGCCLAEADAGDAEAAGGTRGNG